MPSLQIDNQSKEVRKYTVELKPYIHYSVL